MYFIAEIGQNHNGSLDTAKQLVDSLEGSGVMAIKTAKRDIKSFPEIWKTTPYENEHSFGKTYYEHRCALELSNEDFISFARYVESKGFDFISSFTDIPSFHFLYRYVKPKYYKIASSRVVDIQLLQEVALYNVDTILSTGMSTLKEIDTAVKMLIPKVIMQCTSAYPTRYEDINLDVICEYWERYGEHVEEVGFSGHHLGIFPDVIAYSLGATWIERHYTLDRDMVGTDHKLSLVRSEIDELMRQVDIVDSIIGTSKKTVLESEKGTIKKLRSDLHI